MINNIPNIPQIEKEPQKKYELTIKDESGKTLYQNKGYAGIFCFVEDLKNYDPVEVEANHQTLAFGNPLLQAYCLDQFNQWFRKQGLPQVIKEMKMRGYDFGSEVTNTEN